MQNGILASLAATILGSGCVHRVICYYYPRRLSYGSGYVKNFNILSGFVVIPGGVIPTSMIWRKHRRTWATWIVDTIFNVILLSWQLLFLVIGGLLGKVPVSTKPVNKYLKISSRIGAILWGINIIGYAITWPLIFTWIPLILTIFFWGESRGFDWRLIWKAATTCHVRLIIKKGIAGTVWAISFTAPEIKIEQWRPDMIKGRFSYRKPCFDLTEGQVEAMNEYAQTIKGNPTARKYDFLQLLAFCVWLPFWIIYPPCWGKELKPWFNLVGGREVCSSGVTAILRWLFFFSEVGRVFCLDIPTASIFEGYSTSMVSPCLIAINENWRKP